jgi:hypothetical protein
MLMHGETYADLMAGIDAQVAAGEPPPPPEQVRKAINNAAVASWTRPDDRASVPEDISWWGVARECAPHLWMHALCVAIIVTGLWNEWYW